MYHKTKSTLVGLGMVVAFMASGLFLAQPLPAKSPIRAAHAPQVADTAILVRAVLAVTAAEQAAQAAELAAREARRISDTRARSARLRLELGMPFYSFGAMRSRHQES